MTALMRSNDPVNRVTPSNPMDPMNRVTTNVKPGSCRIRPDRLRENAGDEFETLATRSGLSLLSEGVLPCAYHFGRRNCANGWLD